MDEGALMPVGGGFALSAPARTLSSSPSSSLASASMPATSDTCLPYNLSRGLSVGLSAGLCRSLSTGSGTLPLPASLGRMTSFPSFGRSMSGAAPAGISVGLSEVGDSQPRLTVSELDSLPFPCATVPFSSQGSLELTRMRSGGGTPTVSGRGLTPVDLGVPLPWHPTDGDARLSGIMDVVPFGTVVNAAGSAVMNPGAVLLDDTEVGTDGGDGDDVASHAMSDVDTKACDSDDCCDAHTAPTAAAAAPATTAYNKRSRRHRVTGFKRRRGRQSTTATATATASGTATAALVGDEEAEDMALRRPRKAQRLAKTGRGAQAVLPVVLPAHPSATAAVVAASTRRRSVSGAGAGTSRRSNKRVVKLPPPPTFFSTANPLSPALWKDLVKRVKKLVHGPEHRKLGKYYGARELCCERCRNIFKDHTKPFKRAVTDVRHVLRMLRLQACVDVGMRGYTSGESSRCTMSCCSRPDQKDAVVVLDHAAAGTDSSGNSTNHSTTRTPLARDAQCAAGRRLDELLAMVQPGTM